MCASPSRRLFTSEVNSWSMKASSEKFTTKASSWGLDAWIRSSALLFTDGRLRDMEPELSTTSAIETGTSVCWKLISVCRTPSSKTSKLSFFRSGTSRLPSSTVAFSTTSSTSACRTKPAPSLRRGSAELAGGSASGERTGSRSTVSGGACAGTDGDGDCWAGSEDAPADKRTTRTALLQRRMGTGASMDGQRRQSLRRIQLHFHFTLPAVAGQVLGPVADHILVVRLSPSPAGSWDRSP